VSRMNANLVADSKVSELFEVAHAVESRNAHAEELWRRLAAVDGPI